MRKLKEWEQKYCSNFDSNIPGLKVLILDNYDSFTYNLVHLVEQFAEDFEVVRNDRIELEAVDAFEKVLLSPGPGLPADAGIMPDLIRNYASTKSILGICLGMQAIVEFSGGNLYNLDQLMHGVSTPIFVDEAKGLFKNLPKEFEAGRYHSWGAKAEDLPSELVMTAHDEQGFAMAIRHRNLDLCGVQFHPESIMTEHGNQLIGNWLQTDS